MERLREVEKIIGIDAEVYANIPDDAIYTVVVNGQKQVINLQEDNWQDIDDLASLIYDRIETCDEE